MAQSTMRGGILVTGFEPFGKHRVNSSWEAIRALDGATVRGRRVAARLLPVSYARARPLLLRLVRELRPARVVAFGLADEARIRLEKIALNVSHSERPDNDGRRPRDRQIVPGAATALVSRLPLAAIERALKRARLPARLSFHAGTYLCNNIFYTLLASTRIPAGFVHVPPLATRERRKGCLPLAILRRAVAVILQAVP